jgi:large subunit ribosomal protein L29
MKKSDFLAEISRMSKEELKEKARLLAEELMKLRFRKASSGQLDQSHLVKEIRRNFARVNTLISAANAEQTVDQKKEAAGEVETGL